MLTKNLNRVLLIGTVLFGEVMSNNFAVASTLYQPTAGSPNKVGKEELNSSADSLLFRLLDKQAVLDLINKAKNSDFNRRKELSSNLQLLFGSLNDKCSATEEDSFVDEDSENSYKSDEEVERVYSGPNRNVPSNYEIGLVWNYRDKLYEALFSNTPNKDEIDALKEALKRSIKQLLEYYPDKKSRDRDRIAEYFSEYRDHENTKEFYSELMELIYN